MDFNKLKAKAIELKNKTINSAAKTLTESSITIAKSKIEWVNLSDYNIETLPSLVVFEEEKAYKTISWEENILKLVKSFDLDINKLINEIK